MTETHDLTGDIRRIILSPVDNFTFKAGQHVWIGFGEFEPRPYSIASAPAGTDFEVHVKDSHTGGASTYAVRFLHPGEMVSLSAPHGHAIYDRNMHGAHPVLFVAGGLTITGTKALVEAALADTARTQPVTLYWSVRGEEHLYLNDYFKDLAARDPRFHFHTIIENTLSPAVTGFLPSHAAPHVFITGPRPMVEVSRRIFENHGVHPSFIHYDPA